MRVPYFRSALLKAAQSPCAAVDEESQNPNEEERVPHDPMGIR
jgi:hypothetical protein